MSELTRERWDANQADAAEAVATHIARMYQFLFQVLTDDALPGWIAGRPELDDFSLELQLFDHQTQSGVNLYLYHPPAGPCPRPEADA